MAANTWKLVVTPLNAHADMQEVVVDADNWLSALRVARKQLGEEGGVPPGASCVMSATGEVTILDAAQRRRYVLTRIATRSSAPAPAPQGSSVPAVVPPKAAPFVPPANATPAAPSPALASPFAPAAPPVVPPTGAPTAPPAPVPYATKPEPARRLATVAYSPEESQALRSQLHAAIGTPASPSAPQPPANLAPSAPAAPSPVVPNSAPLPASALPGAGAPAPKRGQTVAYSPEESQAVREQLAAARAQLDGHGPAASPEKPAFATPPPAAPAPAAAPSRTPSAPPAPNASAAPRRSNTVAYSPEESSAVREQLLAARGAQASVAPAQAPAGSAGPTLPTPPAAAPTAAMSSPAKKATVAYLESPFRGGALVAIGARDEDPSPSSPLTYRERTFFAAAPMDAQRLEALLQAELARVQAEIATRPRGQFVNLAVFDQFFQGKPPVAPIATLQWKDWRGPAIFQASSGSEPPAFTPAVGEPIRSSFVPPAASAPVPPVVLPPTSRAPSQPALEAAFAPTAPPPAPSLAPEPVAPPLAPPVPAERAPVARPATPIPVAAAPFAPASAPARAPSSAMHTPTPARGPNQSWPAAAVEGTGDQDRRLAVAFEAAQDLYFLSTPAEGLDFAVKLLSELVPCEAASGCIYDINTDEFRFVAVRGPGSAERRAEAVPSTAGLFAAAVRSGREAFVVPQVPGDPRYDPAIDGRVGLSARSMAFFTMQKADNLLGMLQLINRESPRGFSDADLAVASYLASQVAEFLQARRGIGGRRR